MTEEVVLPNPLKMSAAMITLIVVCILVGVGVIIVVVWYCLVYVNACCQNGCCGTVEQDESSAMELGNIGQTIGVGGGGGSNGNLVVGPSNLLFPDPNAHRPPLSVWGQIRRLEEVVTQLAMKIK
jgi:hypothetical protein